MRPFQTICAHHVDRVITRAQTAWLLALALFAVVTGWVTLNMMLVDSGIVVLHHHATPMLTFLSRLGRQA